MIECVVRTTYSGYCTESAFCFDAELVESIICKMHRGKAADIDGITVEHVYYCHSLLPCVLANFFNLMISAGKVPVKFGQSYTVPILKDNTSVYSKTVTVCDFRGISISPVVSKVFEHCILERYGEFFITSNNQFGFKKKSGCAHAIYSLRCVVDYYISHGSTVNICALDLSKAFDKMNHHALFVKLMQRNVPEKLLRVLEYWFAIGSTCVKWYSCFSCAFCLPCGVRQGGVLSPYLFAVYIDSVFTRAKSCPVGCSIKWHCMSIFMYADDIVLLAPSISALQDLLHICEAELAWLDMSLNANKSTSMRIGPRHKHKCCELTIMDGHEILWSKTIRYLGVYLVSSKIFSISLDCAKKSFYRAFNAVFGKVGRVASENVVVELLKTKCLQILSYGLEACRLTKTQLNSLNYAISSSFRKIFNVSSNEIVYFCRCIFNCSNIEDILCIRKRKFLQKYCSLDNIVCALCKHQADIELASLDA